MDLVARGPDRRKLFEIAAGNAFACFTGGVASFEVPLLFFC